MSQSLWPDPFEGKAELGLEWLRPTFEEFDDQYTGTRGVWVGSARVRATDRINLVLAVPRLVATDGANGALIGNPYVGMEFAGDDRRPEFSLGVRINNVDQSSSPALGVALFSDFDRYDAMTSGALVLIATGYHEPYRTPDGAYARLRFGATFFHPTGDGLGAENDMYFNYGVRVGREIPSVRFSAEITGRWLVTADGASFAEASTHQGALIASFLPGTVRPYLGARLPIDKEFGDVVKYVAIIGVTAEFR